MFFRSFTDEKLAHYSYLIGCQQTGEAVIIDPPRHFDHILAVAKKEGLEVIAAADTHIHADYVSGVRQLAIEHGVKLYLSDEGDENWKYDFPKGIDIELVKDGDVFTIGNVDFEVIHTPGHTPESISFILTDRGGGATEALGIFTGDFVFVGDIGRPDLLEEAAGMLGTAETGARAMFKALERFKQLPDYMIVWPAHGAGSACGKSLGAVPMSTVGYEKQFNWALQIDDEEAFIQELLQEQPEAPVYFAEMKRINKIGPDLVKDKTIPLITDANLLKELLEEKDTLLIDTRASAIAQNELIKGSINIPLDDSFTNWAGWLAKYDEGLLLLSEENERDEVRIALQSIGLDKIEAFVDPSIVKNMDTVRYETISLNQFIDQMKDDQAYLIDVRNETEWKQGHFDKANHHFIGYFRETTLPKDIKNVMVYCQTGARSAIAASILKSQGYKNVKHMTSGYPQAVMLNKISV